ncbi:lipoprotein-releasing ABC transporter permease subunit LolE [Vibrio vulnificus]|uniref:Putative ABC transporter, integral membrane protein n=1 Tax=Vibrio vulnificus (strain YJ016) TaxID=196600 RepID=Q7MJ02_VIBVY|nr:lipoprotein-releasing ABC transporter permease subunit LolE [Vibrio vulnificus]AIL71147.1 outer membrane-specific lipoprotein transporter subunit LolE [Vibrio vulnificus]EGR0080572.1 lipoprotein-releasing ABC transporter permease subunit LolE [Vibrio vulnificus]EHH0747533.1 lipoprotein-releasing ABC transporter permease subunit LolE [Vibrio vulnificus]EIO3936104.1 lipoprotein-releasing ABC transporter permease subunit LolE [Vibrio vulnificus]EIO3972008.1 lipoprotein-releasing ABC transporte
MFSSLALLIGRRFSQAKQRNKMVSFISLSSTIGIAVGVAVIIIGLSAMNGFERELQSRVLSVIPHAELEGVRAPVENWQSVMTQAVANPKVVAAAPYVKFTGLVERGNKLKAVEVRGVEPDFEQAVSTMSQFIDQQAWSQFLPGQNQVIVGRGVANELGVDVGDYVTLLIPQTGESTKVQAPKRVRVKVTGMLTLNGQIDHNLVLLPMADAQQYNHLGEGVTGIALKTNDVLNAQAIVREVGRQIDVYVYLRSWQQQFGFLYRDIQLVRTIMYLVMVLVIGVACFNIVSTLMMAVKDRASEIAILRTMGAGDGLIKRIFVWQGVFSGVLGSVLGSVVGVLVALNLTTLIKGLERVIGHQFLSGDIYFVDFLPSQLRLDDVLLVSGTAIVLSIVATWYPAARAAKLKPAAVLSSK